MKKITIILASIWILSFSFNSCNKDKDSKTLDYILRVTFPISKDKEFGAQFDYQLDSNKSEFPVLPDTGKYMVAYDYLERMRDELLKSDDLMYADKFDWPIKIIDKDVLNAFCAPAGYMYYYTGIIKYLDNEAELAGVMAHEMAHADKRHVTKTLLGQYSVTVLLGMILGEDGSELEKIVSQYAVGLGVLKFSRNHEYEADEMAVKYTADAGYYPKGISVFFEKLQAEEKKGVRVPEFLSTHPDPGNRLESIDSVYISIGSPDGDLNKVDYQVLLNSLP